MIKFFTLILLVSMLSGCAAGDMGAFMAGFSEGIEHSEYGSSPTAYAPKRNTYCSELNGLTNCW